jgi:hypothetical protein
MLGSHRGLRLLKGARELIGAFDDRGGFIRIVKRGELGAGLDSLDRSLDSFGTRFRVNNLLSIIYQRFFTIPLQNNRLVDIQISLGTVAEHVSKTYDTVWVFFKSECPIVDLSIW